MDILGVPEQVIALNGSLAINFGIGGRKGAYAHYNSATRTLALAKNAGGGALAHEWFHAFDHYICKKVFTTEKPNLFASEVWLNELERPIEHPLNKMLMQAFCAMFLCEDGTKPSTLMQVSIKVDKAQKVFYYARPQEISARAFERMVQENPIKNSFLVKGTMQTKEAEIGLYPHKYELAAIAKSLTSYFHYLGKALGA